MNILVTGANGQLGLSLRAVAASSADNYIYTDVVEIEGFETRKLDITNITAVREFVRAEGVEAVINCAAYTNVEKAEEDELKCYLLNAKGPENLAVVMKEVGGILFQISTDYIFGGDPYNTPATEEQKGNPTGAYGMTKLQAEENIANTRCRNVIIRTSWLYSEYGKNFVKTMLELTSTKKELSVVFDQVGTPTYAPDLAAFIFDIVENRKYEKKEGVYNYANEGVCSWYDFAVAIARRAAAVAARTGSEKYAKCAACRIRPCHSSEFPSNVTRPAFSVLDKSKAKKVFKAEIPYWTDSLDKCLENLVK